jgi:hypothetical protein
MRLPGTSECTLSRRVEISSPAPSQRALGRCRSPRLARAGASRIPHPHCVLARSPGRGPRAARWIGDTGLRQARSTKYEKGTSARPPPTRLQSTPMGRVEHVRKAGPHDAEHRGELWGKREQSSCDAWIIREASRTAARRFRNSRALETSPVTKLLRPGSSAKRAERRSGTDSQPRVLRLQAVSRLGLRLPVPGPVRVPQLRRSLDDRLEIVQPSA